MASDEDAEMREKMAGDETELALHELASLPLEAIFQYTTLTEILECANMTKDMYTQVRSVDLKLSAIRVLFHAQKPCIKLQYKNKFYEWSFFLLDGQRADTTQKIGWQTFRCHKTAWGVHADHHDIEHSLTRVFSHFVGFFNCSDATLAELYIDLSVIEDVRLVLEHFKHFKNVRRVAVVRSGASDRLGKEVYAVLEWILAKLRPDQIHLGIEFDDPKRDRFELERLEDMLLARDHVSIDHSSWVNKEKLYTFAGKTLILDGGHFNSEDYCRFMEVWRKRPTPSNLAWIDIRIGHQPVENVFLEMVTPRNIIRKCACPWRIIDGMPQHYYFSLNTKEVLHSNKVDTARVSLDRNHFFFHVRDFGPPERQIPFARAAAQRVRFLDRAFEQGAQAAAAVVLAAPPPNAPHRSMQAVLIVLRPDVRDEIERVQLPVVPHFVVGANEEAVRRRVRALHRQMRRELDGQDVDVQEELDENDEDAEREHARRHLELSMNVHNDVDSFEWIPLRDARIEYERIIEGTADDFRLTHRRPAQLTETEQRALELWVHRELRIRNASEAGHEPARNLHVRPVREIFFSRLQKLLNPDTILTNWMYARREIELLLTVIDEELAIHERHLTKGVGDEIGFLRSEEWARTQKIRAELNAYCSRWRKACKWQEQSMKMRDELQKEEHARLHARSAMLSSKSVESTAEPSGSNAVPCGSNAVPCGSNAVPCGSNAEPETPPKTDE